MLLSGFLGGCGIAAVAVRMLADWAWVGPVVLAAFLTLVAACSDHDEPKRTYLKARGWVNTQSQQSNSRRPA